MPDRAIGRTGRVRPKDGGPPGGVRPRVHAQQGPGAQGRQGGERAHLLRGPDAGQADGLRADAADGHPGQEEDAIAAHLSARNMGGRAPGRVSTLHTFVESTIRRIISALK